MSIIVINSCDCYFFMCSWVNTSVATHAIYGTIFALLSGRNWAHASPYLCIHSLFYQAHVLFQIRLFKSREVLCSWIGILGLVFSGKTYFAHWKWTLTMSHSRRILLIASLTPAVITGWNCSCNCLLSSLKVSTY